VNLSKYPRSSGVQLHVTSLPDGRLGPSAFVFVDWLAEAGQSWWQVLPLSPPDRQASPYRARSAFAAWRRLLADPAARVAPAEAAAFRGRHAFWIGDWERVAGARAVNDQVRFEREWGSLRAHAARRGVRLIGDVPIYVAPGSADHRLHPELFLQGLVAGAPPDAYSAVGQLWGNPLYDWPAHRRRRYAWWVQRLRRTFELFDVARLDHFRGFLACWAVPEDARDASLGHWRRGPGAALFDIARRELGELPVFAEDLGLITERVIELRRELQIPGMAVLQFAFGEEPQAEHQLHRHEPDSVAYTGTHDQDTVLGWWQTLPVSEQVRARETAAAESVAEQEPNWLMIGMLMSSPAQVTIVQMQDVLGLGSEARMNVPGRATGNWRWRLGPAQLTSESARRLRAATVKSGRLSPSDPAVVACPAEVRFEQGHGRRG
jgi:4-alpha-glucanotransferase